LLHGGTFFSSGNDISKLAGGFSDPKKAKTDAVYGVNTVMVRFLL